MISNLDITKYSKKEMEDILSLNYPYSNIEIEQQADNMVKNLHRDNKLPQEDRKKVSFFIGEIKAFLTLPTSYSPGTLTMFSKNKHKCPRTKCTRCKSKRSRYSN